MEEKEVKEKEKKEVKGRSTKSKVMTVMLGVSFFCVLSLLLLAIFDDGTIFGGKAPGEPPKDQEKPQAKAVQRKKVIVDCGKDSEVTFNGYTVKMVASTEDNPVCKTDSITINGKEIISVLGDDSYFGVHEYELFDKYLVFSYGDTSGVMIGVYNIETGEFKSYLAENFEYFMCSEWQSDDTGITFPKCDNSKAQTMPEGETNDHNKENAEFRMDYQDGKFTDPKFVKEYGNDYAF